MYNAILKSVYLVRKFLKTFDLWYEKIHNCVNDIDCLEIRKRERIVVRSVDL